MTIEERVKMLERELFWAGVGMGILVLCLLGLAVYTPAIGQSSAQVPGLPFLRVSGILVDTGKGQITIGKLGSEGLGLQIINNAEKYSRGKSNKPDGMALIAVHDTGPALVLQDRRAEGSKIVANVASGQPGMYIIDNHSRMLWKTRPQKISLDNPLPADTVSE